MSYRSTLELQCEAISSEVQDLLYLENSVHAKDRKSFKAMLSNITTANDTIYCVMERMEDTQQLKEENEVLKSILRQYISYQDEDYIRIKYNIKL